MFDFLLMFGGTGAELGRILGTRYVPGSPDMLTPLGRSLRGVLTHNNQGRYRERDYELLKLQFFIHQLKRLEVSCPKLLKYYAKQFRRAGSSDGFFGLRFEVNIASSLTHKAVNFEKTERPDFRLPDLGVELECTSARFRKPRGQGHLTYKIAAVVRLKAKKGYATRSTALFIDITNVAQAGLPFNPAPFRKAAEECSGSSPFGAIVLALYIMNRDLDRLESTYLRIDHSEASVALRHFLDTCWPRGSHRVWDFSVPYEG